MPGPPPPNPEHIARVWELFCEQRPLREVAEIMRQPAPRGRGISISHETVRQWVRKARDAETWMVAQQDAEKLDERATAHARYLAFLERIAKDGIDRYTAGGGNYEQVAPVVLRAGAEIAKLLGLYAPTRVQVEGSVLPPSPDPQTAAIVAVMEERARELATAEGRALLTGEKESPDVAPQ